MRFFVALASIKWSSANPYRVNVPISCAKIEVEGKATSTEVSREMVVKDAMRVKQSTIVMSIHHIPCCTTRGRGTSVLAVPGLGVLTPLVHKRARSSVHSRPSQVYGFPWVNPMRKTKPSSRRLKTVIRRLQLEPR